MSLIRKHVAVLQAWACLALVSIINCFIFFQLLLQLKLIYIIQLLLQLQLTEGTLGRIYFLSSIFGEVVVFC